MKNRDFESYSDSKLENTYQYAINNHTWEKRGEQIVEFFENDCKSEDYIYDVLDK